MVHTCAQKLLNLTCVGALGIMLVSSYMWMGVSVKVHVLVSAYMTIMCERMSVPKKIHKCVFVYDVYV